MASADGQERLSATCHHRLRASGSYLHACDCNCMCWILVLTTTPLVQIFSRTCWMSRTPQTCHICGTAAASCIWFHPAMSLHNLLQTLPTGNSHVSVMSGVSAKLMTHLCLVCKQLTMHSLLQARNSSRYQLKHISVGKLVGYWQATK